MTNRVLAAMDDPHLTILAHPTGRLLLSREPYAINVEAVLEKAADGGAAGGANAEPRRLDLDWRYCRQAKELGVKIEIGPDAHSTAGLDNVHFGIGMARKAWLEAGENLNTGSAEDGLWVARGRGRGKNSPPASPGNQSALVSQRAHSASTRRRSLRASSVNTPTLAPS